VVVASGVATLGRLLQRLDHRPVAVEEVKSLDVYLPLVVLVQLAGE
jgi:hypothetical protein